MPFGVSKLANGFLLAADEEAAPRRHAARRGERQLVDLNPGRGGSSGGSGEWLSVVRSAIVSAIGRALAAR